MIKTILVMLLMAFSLSSCGYLTNNFEDYNSRVSQMNMERQKAYGDSLAACAGEPGCLVGVTGSYYNTSGRMPLKEPETPLAYLGVLHPYLRLAADIWGPGRVGRNEGGLSVAGNHNIFVDVANKKSADNQSTLTHNMDTQYSWTQEFLNEDYTFGSSGTGVTEDASFVPTDE